MAVEGWAVGLDVGSLVGARVGIAVGYLLGGFVLMAVGSDVGLKDEGKLVGLEDGSRVSAGQP